MCDKITFLTYEAAVTSAHNIKKSQRFIKHGNKKRIPKRAYKCKTCGLYHLTSIKVKHHTNRIKPLNIDVNVKQNEKLGSIWKVSDIRKDVAKLKLTDPNDLFDSLK